MWLSSMTDTSIRRAFGNLRSGSDFDGLADAARSRSEADWLVGLNATRAMTLAGQTRVGSANTQGNKNNKSPKNKSRKNSRRKLVYN